MSILSEIFCWWGGNTWGTRFTLMRLGAKHVGSDEHGNNYYVQTRGVGPLGVPRRWVIYRNLSEASLVPPDWHGWMHYTVDTPPTEENYTPRPWQKAHQMNMTGTRFAWRPAGSIVGRANRPKATGDYKAWKPE